MSFTLIVVIMTGIISYQAFNNPAMRQRLLFHPYSIKKSGELYRFISHGFVHGSWTHLLINLFVLYQFGEVIEAVFVQLVFGPTFGRLAFLLFYVSAVVVSSIPSYFKNQNNAYYGSLGASGATSALVFIYIMLDPWQWFLFPPLPAIVLAIAYLWYSSYMSKRGGDNIAHDAHLYGAVFGLVFAIVAFALFNPLLLDNFIVKLLAGPTVPSFM
jgi:membrane associated rhomboid family serine protease